MIYTCGHLKVIRESVIVLSLSTSNILAGSTVVRLGSQRANLSAFLFLSHNAVETVNLVYTYDSYPAALVDHLILSVTTF
jgi:hypothetical protein